MTPPTALVVAKAPVPGFAKTRIARDIGDVAAAELAAAALLDTLDVVRALGWPVVVALTGDLAQAARGQLIADALAGVTVVPQSGEDFAQRLVNAHRDADRGAGVVQIGMDTPQVEIGDFHAARRVLSCGGPVLGPATDGGWWLLGVRRGVDATPLGGVPMSCDDTADLTRRALGGGLVDLRVLRDMDTWDDARLIGAAIPGSRLASLVEAVA